MSETEMETRSLWAERRSKPILSAALSVEGVCIALMMLLTVVHSAGRYAFNRPIPGLIEMSELLLVTAIFMAGAYTMFVKRHVSIGIVVDRLLARTQAIIGSITYSLGLVVIVLALWQTIVRGISVMEWGQSSIILAIPTFPFVYIVAFGWGLLGWVVLMHLVDFIRQAVKK